MNFHREYLTLIQQTRLLLEEDPLILASAEEADFFRQAAISLAAQKVSLGLRESVLKPRTAGFTTGSASQTQFLNGEGYKQKKEIDVEKTQSRPLEPALIEPSLSPNSPKPVESSPNYVSLSLFFPLFAKIAPEIVLLKKIPDDAIAKKIASRWKTKNQTAPITLLLFSEPESHQKFLKEITKALDIYFGSAKIVQADAIEKEKQWETFLSSEELKLVIVCDYTLWQLNGLMQFYKEVPAQGTRLLGKKDLFLLPDLSLYLKDPLLKRSLWKALCQKIS